tara:strand:+ start:958 stop:1236 length:279 start_codon:yes stop_codon:yes gene_type:complete
MTLLFTILPNPEAAYLVFKGAGLGLIGAIVTLAYLKTKGEKPIKTPNGDYLIKKPNNTKGIQYDSEINLKDSNVNASKAIKNPSGHPTKPPR